jgi:hypothetical protein
VTQPIGPVIESLLAEAERLDELAVTLKDPHERAAALSQAINTRAQATVLALSPDDDEDDGPDDDPG